MDFFNLFGLLNTIYSIVFPERKKEIDDLKDPRTLPVMRQCSTCSTFILNDEHCCNEIKIWV